ncbi:MAG: hypothetical protein TREMPRED_000809 [Tremellales sp. Tagirdzhanova-0007]|nr:MAG: hypothetical protein TREMPRED_000809 [Tremellales sp. Tagirdzhanova-0007]
MSNPYLPSSPASSSTTASSSQSQPITRSRTLFYLSIRDSSVTTYNRRGPRRAPAQYGDTVDVADDEQDGLIGGRDGSVGVGMRRLPPKWVDLSDEIEDILGRAKAKIAFLDKLHAKHVLPGFTDRSAEEREIERQTTDITKDIRRCTNLIASIQPTTRAARVQVVTAKNVQRGLAQKVQELSGQFRKKQRVYMQKLQGHAIKNKDLLAASGAVTLKGSDSLDELQEDEQALQSQSQAIPEMDLNIEQRSNEITQIATSISELADLFRDLGGMIVEQGTVLDSVEYNVQTTARELVGAVEELKVAQKYQANTGRRKCILFLFLCIAGVIIVLVYKPRVTTDTLTNFFSSGVLLHPQPHSDRQWAQVWVATREQVEMCMRLKATFAERGINVSLPPNDATPALPSWFTPDSTPILPSHPDFPPSPQSLASRGPRPEELTLGYRHMDPQGPLPRNLYTMGLPLDMAQMQFKELFVPFGMVEHSTLLSQLDGFGRRRGFILMSTHREAIEAIQGVNGRYIEIDVSWALVQREAKHSRSNMLGALPNRVIHPPAMPTRWEFSIDSSVIVDNLDTSFFPDAGAIRDIFSPFGPILRVSVLRHDPLQVLIQFEHSVSAVALIKSNGMSLAGRPILTRSVTPLTPATPPIHFDPFGQDLPRTPTQDLNRLIPGLHQMKLTADSRPFVSPTRRASNDSPANEPSSSPNVDNFTVSKLPLKTGNPLPWDKSD